MTTTPDLYKALTAISTATLTTVLLKKGLRRTWMQGPKPLVEGQTRVVGEAFTLRFVPAREDLATPASWASPNSTRVAIEAMPPRCIAVADAMGITAAGIFGDILALRMQKRGVTALVTDGVMRDAEGVRATHLPIWCAGAAAPPSVACLTFVGWQEPIGCGAVAIFPGDTIVADGDGAVCIPKVLVADVTKEAVEQEAFENWAMAEVGKGAALPGLYPPNEETKKRYEAARKNR